MSFVGVATMRAGFDAAIGFERRRLIRRHFADADMLSMPACSVMAAENSRNTVLMPVHITSFAVYPLIFSFTFFAMFAAYAKAAITATLVSSAFHYAADISPLFRYTPALRRLIYLMPRAAAADACLMPLH